MYLKNILILLCCILFPALGLAQNSTSSLENIRDTKLLSIQNHVFELQKVTGDLQKKFTGINTALAELKKSTTDHEQDILHLLDAINTTNSNTLETGENLGSKIADIRQIQEKQHQDVQKFLASLGEKQKEADSRFSDLTKKINQRLATEIRALGTINTKQDTTLQNLNKKILVLKNAMAADQKNFQEFKDTLTIQRQKTLGHLSSLENLNATLSGIQERSQTELKNLHQSLAQVVTYGLLTVIGVALLALLILLIMRRKPRMPSLDETPTDPIHHPVEAEDDEILDWLKQKGNSGK